MTSDVGVKNVDIHEFIERDRNRIVEFARELIAIPSENPPGARYEEAVNAIVRHLKQLGFDPQIHGNCVLTFVGDRDDRVLYFSGHYDVVPAQDSHQFEPVVKGRNLFGRGSSDMKGGLAAMVYATKAVRDGRQKLAGQIGLVFVPDEETAGPRGSRALEQEGLLGRNAVGMLTPEPTGGIIWNANRGAITAKATLTGKPAHVGRQFEGINAFEGMMRLVQSLAELKKDVETRATAFAIEPERAKHSILLLGGQSAGGTNFNVVPEACWFTVDRRINPEEDFETEKRRLISLVQNGAKPCEARIEILQEGLAAGTPADTPLGNALARSIQRVSGTAPRFEMCPGLLETRFYAAHGIPAYAYGPGLLTVSHGPNEFVPIDNVTKCAAIYASTALELLSQASGVIPE
ncbi:MAG TPA: ArgE/DapE family deacylase [Terriglobales bacterium]|nr:ArgE/DapE family deacylase [Terriglobales bacterium]